MRRGSTDSRRKAEPRHPITERVVPGGARSGRRVRWMLAIGAALLLVACGRDPVEPFPPHAPPRPVTKVSNVITAQLVLPARPVPPSPGQM